MQRMHPLAALPRIRVYLLVPTLTFALVSALGGRASADLIRPTADRAYPDVAADIRQPRCRRPQRTCRWLDWRCRLL